MATPQHRRPLWLGVVLSAVAVPLCFAVLMLRAAPTHDDFRGIVGAFAVTSLVELAAILMLGLPYILWLRSRGTLNAVFVCLGATLVGALTVAILNVALNWNHRPPAVSSLAYGAGLGFFAGVVFCAGAGIWTRRATWPSNDRLQRTGER